MIATLLGFEATRQTGATEICTPGQAEAQQAAPLAGRTKPSWPTPLECQRQSQRRTSRKGGAAATESKPGVGNTFLELSWGCGGICNESSAGPSNRLR